MEDDNRKFYSKDKTRFQLKTIEEPIRSSEKIIQCLVALDITNWYRLQPTYKLCGDGTRPMDRILEGI